MDAIILAAGLGTRLMPLTTKLPKPMMPIFDRPLLSRQIEWLVGQGIHTIVANSWHRSDVMYDFQNAGGNFGENTQLTFAIYRDPDELLGTGGGVRQLASKISTQPAFFVQNGDVVFAADLRAAYQTHRTLDADLTLVVVQRPDLPRSLHKVGWGPDGVIRSIDGVPDASPNLHYGIYSGALVATERLLNVLPKSGASCLKTDGFWPMMTKGYRLAAHVSPTYWSDIGTPESYLTAHFDVMRHADSLSHWFATPGSSFNFVSDSQTPSASIQPGQSRKRRPIQLIPPYFVGDNVLIDPDAVIGPWAIVGNGASLQRMANVAYSLIWPGSVVSRTHRGSIVTPDYVLTLEPQKIGAPNTNSPAT